MSSLNDNKLGLAALLDTIIPPDVARGLPGGSEVDFQPEASSWENLKIVDEASTLRFEKKFHALTPKERQSVVEGLTRPQKTAFARLAKSLAEYYYLRPEVAQTIGAGASPPFPEGYRVEEGDITLLEPVYLRGKIYRDV